MGNDPQGQRLPIKLDATSNGEYEPIPLDPVAAYARAEAEAATDAAARRLNMPRREFLISSCGAAASLAAMDQAFAQSGVTGGRYEIPQEASFELAAADAAVGGDEFIFDVQLHHIDRTYVWTTARGLGGMQPEPRLEPAAGRRADARCERLIDRVEAERGHAPSAGDREDRVDGVHVERLGEAPLCAVLAQELEMGGRGGSSLEAVHPVVDTGPGGVVERLTER